MIDDIFRLAGSVWCRCRERAAVGLGIHFASEPCDVFLCLQNTLSLTPLSPHSTHDTDTHFELVLDSKTIGEHCKPEHQPDNITHTQRQTPSRQPRQPANWPVGQNFANCLSTFCQHVANLLPTVSNTHQKVTYYCRNIPNILPNFRQPAVSTQVHQCFCVLYFGCCFLDDGKPFICLQFWTWQIGWQMAPPS